MQEGRMSPSPELAMLLAEALEVPAGQRASFLAFTRGGEEPRPL
jgi:hypothetical protein